MKAEREAVKEKPATRKPAKQSKDKPSGSGPRKLSQKERREMDALEKKIAEAEERQAEISSRLHDAGSDFDRVSELSQELQTLQHQMDRDMARWEELAELE